MMIDMDPRLKAVLLCAIGIVAIIVGAIDQVRFG